MPNQTSLSVNRSGQRIHGKSAIGLTDDNVREMVGFGEFLLEAAINGGKPIQNSANPFVFCRVE